MRDRRNFVQCVRALVPDARVRGQGAGAVRDRERPRASASARSRSASTSTRSCGRRPSADVTRQAAELHRLLPNRKLVLGIDRLDYTKGIPHRLQAFHDPLDRCPQLRGKISLIQVVVPSRVDIPEYDELKSTIEQLVGEINGEFMKPGGWVPVWYVYGSLSPTELLALLPRRRRRAGHAAARRHEPRREGILRVQHRRGLRAHPERVRRRRGAAAARCAARQSVRHRRRRRRDPRRVLDGAPSAASACAGCATRSATTTSSGGSTRSSARRCAADEAALARAASPVLEMDADALHAANDAVDTSRRACRDPDTPPPHANLLN